MTSEGRIRPGKSDVEPATKAVVDSLGSQEGAKGFLQLLVNLWLNDGQESDYKGSVLASRMGISEDAIKKRKERLNEALKDFYANEQGKKTRVRIRLPDAGYKPVIDWNPDFERPDVSRTRRWLPALVVALLGIGCAVWYLLRKPEPIVCLAVCSPQQSFQPIVNGAWFKGYRRDFGDVDVPDGKGGRRIVWTGVGVSRSRDSISQTFAALKQSGIKGVVWFLLADGAAAPDFNADGFATGLESSFLADYRMALDLAKQHALPILWVLMDHFFLRPAERRADGAILYGHADVITDEAKQKAFFDKVLDPILQIDPGSPYIAGWILMNEPEVALDEGDVSEEEIVAFLRATAARIKLRQKDKPISIGHLDLESLVEFQLKYKNFPLDFLVFHHYRRYMPPDVTHIRRVAGNATQPIYIGEFSLNEPSKPRPLPDLNALVRWTFRFGYAGIWPWSLNTGTVPEPQIDEVAKVAAYVEQVRGNARSPDESERRSIQEHAGHVMSAVQQQMETWKGDLDRHKTELAKNEEMHKLTIERLAKEESEVGREAQELEKAREVHAQNLEALRSCRERIQAMEGAPHDPDAMAKEKKNEKDLLMRIDGPNGSAEYVRKAEANLDRRQKQADGQRRWLATYEMRVRSNRYQLARKQRYLELDKSLYLEYWQKVSLPR